MAANEQELIATFLEITMCNCRVSALKILEDVEWNIEAAIQLFFEGGSSHGESTVLPSNPFFYLDSTIAPAPTGWGSNDEDEDEDEVDDGQKHFDLDATIQPSGWGSNDEDEDEVDEGQKHFDLDATIQPSGFRCPEDENEGEEAQEHLDFDSEIVPTVDGALEYPNFLPVINERLYDDDSELYRLESSSVSTEDSDWKEEEFDETNLSLLPGRRNDLEFHGHFHEAKVESSHLDRWLLVAVQTSEQFNSNLLNRETWPNVSVQELLKSHFLFWQINQKYSEGQKVCCFYNLMAFPAILVVDPITGGKMYACQGMKQHEDFLEDLMRFSDTSPKQHLLASSRRENASASTDQTVANEASQCNETSPEFTIKTNYPPLPEEPTEKKHICKVGICLRSGERVHRSFLKTDSTKLLWSFCSTFLKKEEESQSFFFIVPRFAMLFYDTDKTFEEAGLSNTLLRLSFGGDKG